MKQRIKEWASPWPATLMVVLSWSALGYQCSGIVYYYAQGFVYLRPEIAFWMMVAAACYYVRFACRN